MDRRTLGTSGIEISGLAYGLMSLSHTYGQSEDAEAIQAIHAALDAGIRLLDTAEVYGMGHNERLFAEVLEKRRDEVIVATKFGLEIGDGGMRANGRPENVRRAIEGSLERLGHFLQAQLEVDGQVEAAEDSGGGGVRAQPTCH